jgi:nuclear pore complex protein Nup155
MYDVGAIGAGDPGTGEMHLLPEPLYSIPTDSTFITTIAGTNSGRIFMAGKDGALYELIYQVLSPCFTSHLKWHPLSSKKNFF